MLACEKTASIYGEIFRILVELKPSLKPEHITIDFEQAVIKAIRKCFTEARIHGCNFHFSQNIWKHIQQVGLQTKYADDADFALSIRMILALAFVPIPDIEKAFTIVTSCDIFVENEEYEHNAAIQTFLNYVETTYIGRFDRAGKRRSGLFPKELWNVYDITLQGISNYMRYYILF